MCQRVGKTGQHGDMQPGYGHQVIGARAQKSLPVRLPDSALVTDRQRAQDAGVRSLCQHRIHMVADAFAQAFHQVARPIDQLLQQMTIAALTHISAGADVAFQRPRLKVKTVRVQTAVRALEPDRQLPALPGTIQGVPGNRTVRLTGIAVDVMRQGNMGRHHRARSQHALHIELETQAALTLLRQAGNDADHLDIPPLPLDRQMVGQSDLSIRGRPEETGGKGQQYEAETMQRPSRARMKITT
jgi:hypothetical protein